jgi:hypothetical protein
MLVAIAQCRDLSRSLSSQTPEWRVRIKRVVHTSITVAILGLVLAATALGQYKEYPQTRGDVQPYTFHEIPSRMTLDMELCGRTEGQTAINYVVLPGAPALAARTTSTRSALLGSLQLSQPRSIMLRAYASARYRSRSKTCSERS